MTRFVLLCAVAALVGGCPTMPRPNPPLADAGSALVGRSCSVDAECGGLRCDGQRRQCICLSDESCKSSDPTAPPKYCNNFTGLCVEEISGCTSSVQCAMAEFCDPSTRTCRPVKAFCQPCTSDLECGGDGDNCLVEPSLNAKFCGRACVDNSQCPRGATCQDFGGVKQCWPSRGTLGQAQTCRTFQGCTPDSLRTCNTTAECMDPSQRCDSARGRCVAVQQVCPFGTTCDPNAKLCVAECASDLDCGDPRLVCVNKACQLTSSCMADSECSPQAVCTKPPGQAVGRCTAFCAADAESALGQACKPVGTKFACQPGCTNNAGCPLDQRCNTTTRLCEGPVVGSVRTCQATSACGLCEVCKTVRGECEPARRDFPHCTPCMSQNDCPGGSCVQLADGNSYCAAPCGAAGQECPRGFTCSTLTTGGQACVPADRLCMGKC